MLRALLLILVATLASSSSAEIHRHRVNPPRPATPMLLGDPLHSNHSDHPIPTHDLKLAWRSPIPPGFAGDRAELILASPTQDALGNLYIATTKGSLSAFNPDGELLWNIQLPGEVSATPALDDQGQLFIATRSGQLFALDTHDGSTLWTQVTSDELYASPTLHDDRIYLSAYDTTEAFTTSGGHLWTYITVHRPGSFESKRTGRLNSTVAVAPDGTVFIHSWAGYLIAVDGQSGRERWRRTTCDLPNGWNSTPTLHDEHVAVTCLVHEDFTQPAHVRAYGFTFDGSTKLWQTDLEGGSCGSPCNAFPSADRLGNTLTTNDSGHIYAIQPDGTLHFDTHIPERSISASLTTDPHGNIFTVSRDGTLIVLNEDGHILTWFQTDVFGLDGSPTVGIPHNGLPRVYIAAGGELFAYEGSVP